MKHTKFLLSFLLMTLLLVSSAFSQESAEVEVKLTKRQERRLKRKQRREIKRAFKKLRKRILKDEELSREYFELLNTCKEEDEECQRRLEEVVQESVQGTSLERSANGLMFGICKTSKDSKKFHKVVYSTRKYDCKLSSHGEVYDKSVERKLYGPGIWYDKQTIVLFCTGPAYGKKMTGFTVAAGAYFGITATTMVGKVGLCLAVGAGKSGGFFLGADKYEFEDL